MKDEYYTNKECLKGWYKNKYEIVNNYCSILLSDVDEDTRNNVMLKIVNDFLDAQNNKVPVSNIIGDDIEEYCEKECGINLPIKYRIKYIFDILKYWGFVLIVFDGSELIFNYKNQKLLDIRNDSFSFFVSIVLCIIAAYVYRIINLHSVKRNFKDIIIKIIVPFIFLSVLLICAGYFPIKYNMTMPTWLEVLICFNVFSLSKIIYRKSKGNKNYFLELAVKQEINESKKIYEKKKKKNIKNESEFIEYKISKLNNNLKYNKLYLMCPFVFSTIPTIFLIFYINVLESLLFFVALFTIELIIFIPIYRNSRDLYMELVRNYEYFKDNGIPVKDWK